MAHYAISEALIVLAGLWAAPRLYRQARPAAAFAIMLFSFAALLGVIRFAFDRQAEMAEIHRLAGTLGGLAAMMALVFEMIDRRGVRLDNWRRRYLLAAALGLGLAISLAWLRVPLFLLLSVTFIILVVKSAPLLGRRVPVAMMMAGIMLVNVVVFRQAAWLSPAVAWHVFHVLVAVWLVALGLLLYPPRRRA